jgi:hypothetical protein
VRRLASPAAAPDSCAAAAGRWRMDNKSSDPSSVISPRQMPDASARVPFRVSGVILVNPPFRSANPHFDVIINGSPCSKPCSDVK